eukprot:bmy_18994T0
MSLQISHQVLVDLVQQRTSVPGCGTLRKPLGFSKHPYLIFKMWVLVVTTLRGHREY